MKKILLLLTLSFTIIFANNSLADVEYKSENYNKSFIPLDLIIFRPLGLVTTVVGTAVFVGVSPFTALASIPEPHNAFHKTANLFIMGPAHYTFSRPLGDTSLVQFPDP